MVLNGEPLLGRERELAVLDDAVAAALHQGAALLVVGEPGIGKSALLATAGAAARRAGCTVLSASGVESETHLPFGGVHQVLAPLMRHLSCLSESHHEAMSTVLGLSDGTNPDLFLIAEAALALLVRERAEHPLVVVVDDVQWLDSQSHQILTFIAYRGPGAGITVIAATRPGHPGPFGKAGFPRLEIEGVDDETAAHLLQAHSGKLGAAELVQVRLEAQGNPLALLELPLSWDARSPEQGHPLAMSAKLERAFSGRVSELPAGTRDALLVAAVGSSSRTDEILRAVAAFGTTGEAAGLLGPAVAAGLLTDDLSSIGFRHPLVRSAILQGETLGRRRAAHAALAQVLGRDSYRQSWHRAWSIIGPDDQVAQALMATVPGSLRRGAVMSAVASLERAAELTISSTIRGERLVSAAFRAFEAGRADVVGRLLREAARADLGDLDRIRATWLTEALNSDVRPDPALVRHLLDSAAQAQQCGDQGLALDLALAAALRSWWADSAGERSRTVGVLDGMTGARTDPRYLAALSVAAPVHSGAEVMAALAVTALDQVDDGDMLRYYGLAAYGVGDVVLATDLLDRAEEVFRGDGRLGMLPVVLALQLHIRLDLGDWAGADLAAHEVVTISQETGQEVFADNNILVEARGMALRGQWRSALDTMAAAEADAWRLHINDRICLAYQARGAALLSAGRPADAFACLHRQYDPADPGYHLRESFAGVALMAEAAVAGGRVEDARRIVQSLESIAVLTTSPLLEVNLLYACAVLAPKNVREQRFRDALSRDLTRWPWPRARIQLAYGQWLSETGSRSDAAAHLRCAADVFAQLGATRWLRSAQRSLSDLGHHGASRP